MSQKLCRRAAIAVVVVFLMLVSITFVRRSLKTPVGETVLGEARVAAAFFGFNQYPPTPREREVTRAMRQTYREQGKRIPYDPNLD